MKSKSLILLVLSIGFGLLAAIGISQVMKNNVVADTSEPMGQVVLAASSLILNTELTEENVKIATWRTSIIPPEAITSLEEIKDMVNITPLSQGLPIVKGAIQHKSAGTGPPIPNGMKVVAVRVSADDTIGNLLNPGNKVDVIGVFKQRDPNTNHTTTNSRTFLKALQVYSIGNKTQVDITKSQGNGSANSIVGLLVTEKQSEALVFVQDTGSIKLVLRGDDAENDGEVGRLEDIEKIVAKKDDFKPKAPTGGMKIWLGNKVETTQLNSDGSRSDPDDMARDGKYGDSDDRGGSGNRGDSDRGIDDDQYRGE